ncbi:10330_t:CDS:2 [Paraglomus brasilianum]|uniref:10330_t:CDS:1 n=1 Tax=Paraglomus brasilianum TaxID=144538 RepID=A0A9N9BXQ7_9GLOM|nr:10330_t:CDS:2 [Paraglomus brasilianum]
MQSFYDAIETWCDKQTTHHDLFGMLEHIIKKRFEGHDRQFTVMKMSLLGSARAKRKKIGIEKVVKTREMRELIKSVEWLEISGCCVCNGVFTAIGERCRNLTTLTLCFPPLQPPLPSLSPLVPALSTVSSLTLFNLYPPYISLLFSSLPVSTLRTLHIFNTNFESCPPWVTLAKCSKLEYLSIIGWHGITEEMVKPLIETDIKKLRGVIVSGEEWSEVDKMLRDWWSRCVRGHPIVSNGKGGRKLVISSRRVGIKKRKGFNGRVEDH